MAAMQRLGARKASMRDLVPCIRRLLDQLLRYCISSKLGTISVVNQVHLAYGVFWISCFGEHHIYTHKYTYTHTHTHTHTQPSSTYIHTHAHTRMYICICIHACIILKQLIYIHISIYIHILIYVYISCLFYAHPDAHVCICIS